MIRLLIALFILMAVLSMDHIMTPKLPENNDDEVKNQVISDLTPKDDEEVITEEPKDKSLREGIYISKGNMILGTITLVTIIICLLPNLTSNTK